MTLQSNLKMPGAKYYVKDCGTSRQSKETGIF